MHIIVPIHSTTEYIKEFQKVFEDDNLLFVFDRCNVPEHFYGNYKIFNEDSDRFLAGKVRDYGIEGIDDDILFLDEDKVPNNNPVYRINKLKTKYDAILFFADSNDGRLEKLETDKIDSLLPIHEYNKNKNMVYTCGIYISKEVIRDVKRLNNGRLFAEIFDGIWGCEDNFLGDETLALGYKIGYDRIIHLKNPISIGAQSNKSEFFKESTKKRMVMRNCLSPEFSNHEPICWGKRLITDIDKTAFKLKTVTDCYNQLRYFDEYETNITRQYTIREFPDFTFGIINQNSEKTYNTLSSLFDIHKTSHMFYQTLVLDENQSLRPYNIEKKWHFIKIHDTTETELFSKMDELVNLCESKYLILCNSTGTFIKDLRMLMNDTIQSKYNIVSDNVSLEFLIIDTMFFKKHTIKINENLYNTLFTLNDEMSFKKINVKNYILD